MNYIEFARKIKEKYPEYSDRTDIDLALAMIKKHPEYSTKVTFDGAFEDGTYQEFTTSDDKFIPGKVIKGGELSSRTEQLNTAKEKALNTLRGIYKGDFEVLKENISANKQPKGMNKEQTAMYNVVKGILSANTPEEITTNLSSPELSENRLAPYIVNTLAKQDFYEKAKAQELSGGSDPYWWPNLSYREMKDAGPFSKGIGAVEDVLTLPSRWLTAGVGQLSERGKHNTFDESVARPMELSTGPEQFTDVVGSSILPGEAIKFAGGGLLRAGKNLLAPKGLTRFGKTVYDVEKVPIEISKKGILESGRRGLGEGAAYSVFPATVASTSPDEESPLATFGTDLAIGTAAGGALGALIGGIGKPLGAKAYGKLTDTQPEYIAGEGFSKELLSGKGPLRRLEKLIKTEPALTADEQLTRYNKALDDFESIRKQLGNERDAAIKKIDEHLISINDDAVYISPFRELSERYLTDIEAELLRKNPGKYRQEIEKVIRDIRGNITIDENYAANLVEEITTLGDLINRTDDRILKDVYIKIRNSLKEAEEEAIEEYINATNMGAIRNVRASGELAQQQNNDLLAANEVLKKSRKEFAKWYKVKDKLPKPEKLPTVGQARLQANVNNKFKDYKAAQDELNKMLKDYGKEEIDFVVPSTASAVRHKDFDPEKPGLIETVRGTGLNPYLEAPKALAKYTSKKVLASPVKGQAVQVLPAPGADDSPWNGSLRQWSSIDEMYEDMLRQKGETVQDTGLPPFLEAPTVLPLPVVNDSPWLGSLGQF